MAAFFPDLDLSLVVIDDTIPPTPGGIDVVSDEIDDSVHTVEEEVKDPSVRSSFSLLLKGWLLPWSCPLLMAYLLRMAHLLWTCFSPMLPHPDFCPFLSYL